MNDQTGPSEAIEVDDKPTLEPPPSDSGKAGQPVQHSTAREYFVTIVACTIFALFVTTYDVHPMTVPTPSMVPTIEVGDRLLIDKFTYRNDLKGPPLISAARRVERGDIVVFKFPKDPELLYVKRAIGLPGEIVEVREKIVYINGDPLDEPYAIHTDPNIRRSGEWYHGAFENDVRDQWGPERVPQGNYFVMGDNRDDSADSRYFGYLPEEMIVGRPLVVFWSYKDDADAYRRTSPGELLQLYGERILYFFSKTRWGRIGHVVR